jgi:glycosyltransferase involved in cell wall biosynthesis
MTIHYMTSNGLGNAWVGNELRVVMRSGIETRLHSLVKPGSTFFESADMQRLASETNCLYPLSVAPFVGSLLKAPFKFRGRYFAALWNALTGPRESLVIRAKGYWHFLVACHWADGLDPNEVSLIHSQWIHSGGSVAMYGAWLLGVPFSFTGHAADLFRDRAALTDKVKRAAFIVCISHFHEDFFLKQGARPEQLRLVYCGIDPDHFSPRPPRAGHGPFRILASGRLVEKKGFIHLIEACKILEQRGLAFKCVIAGSGPLEKPLRAAITQMGLEGTVELTGEALKQERIPQFMHSGDVYCLPCVWSSDNDVDGLPQMLMEAMACELPVVSTRLVGIPDLVIDERTGLLAQPNDAVGLADRLQRLLEDPALANQLAKDGRQHVLDKFELVAALEPLVREFRKYSTR